MRAARFRDREEAGRLLGEALRARLEGTRDVRVLALPRGGVPVGAQVAVALRAPLDVLVVRKLGVPGHSELAMGAIASGGTRVLNELVDELRIPPGVVEEVTRAERRELARREGAFRGATPPEPVTGRVVVLVDDGLATGSTMLAAVSALRAQRPASIVVAVPVGSRQACARVAPEVDDLLCLRVPEDFLAVGEAYEDFRQTQDDEVRTLLDRSSDRAARAP